MAPKPTAAELRQAGFVAQLAKAEEARQAGQLERAAEALRRAGELQPQDPRPPFQLCMLLTSANDLQNACTSALWAVELAPGRHLGVLPSEQCPTNKVYPQIGLRAAVMAFDLLIRQPCEAVPRPSWWTDAALLAMSARALADTPNSALALSVRSHCVSVLRRHKPRDRHCCPSPALPLLPLLTDP